jgi:hypothetical protein
MIYLILLLQCNYLNCYKYCFVTFLLMYSNGSNLSINVVNNVINLQLCDNFFNDCNQFNEYLVIILQLLGYQ